MGKGQKGITFLEILISVTIVSIVTILLLQVMCYTIASRRRMETISRAVAYSESFSKLFINQLKKKEILLEQNIIEYLSETENDRQILEEDYELDRYQYSFIMLEDKLLKEGVGKEDLGMGMQFSTEAGFDFSIFNELIENGALTLNVPKQKEVKEIGYEGLMLDLKENGELVARQSTIEDEGTLYIDMEIDKKLDTWLIKIHSRTLKLEPDKAIHMMMNTSYFDGKYELQIEIENNTVCPIMLEIRGEKSYSEKIKIGNKLVNRQLLVYESRLDNPLKGYVLMGIVTIKDDLGKNKVLKQTVFYLWV